MTMHKQKLEKKIKTYIDDLFAGVGPSQALFDLKEELTTNLKEKIADYQAKGMDEEEAFKEAIVSIGDLSGLIDDMRKQGQDAARMAVNTSMTARVSAIGFIAGVLLFLFGTLLVLMMHFMDGMPNVAVIGPGVFIVAGGALITYSLLTRETRKRYAMNKGRAGLYALSTMLLLFSVFVGLSSGFATGEIFIGISSSMVFVLTGVALLLGLLFSGTDRRKDDQYD